MLIWKNSTPILEDDFKNKDRPKKDGAPKNKDDTKNERSVLPGSFYSS